MHIEFTYARPAEYFRGMNRLGARRAVRQRLVVSGLLLLVILLASALVGGQVGLLLGGAGVVGTAIGLWLLRGKYLAALTVPASMCSPRDYVITDKALESRTASTSVRWGWDAVRSVTVAPEAFVFRQEAGAMFDVPRAPLAADQDQELCAFVRERGLDTASALPATNRRH